MTFRCMKATLGYLVAALTACWLLLPALAVSSDVAVVRNSGDGVWVEVGSRRVEFKETMAISAGEYKGEQRLGVVSGLAVDSNGSVYVLDRSNYRVWVYDNNAEFLFSFGEEGDGPGQFIAPSSIAIDDSDVIYVADKNELDLFDVSGTYLTWYQPIECGPVTDIEFDSAGNIYLCCFQLFGQNMVHKYDRNGEHIGSFCESYAKGEEIDVRIESTFAGGHIDIGQNDAVYYTQWLPYEIRMFDRDGVLLSRVHRHHPLMKSPDEYVRREGEGFRFSIPAISSAIFVLSDLGILNCVSIPDATGTIVSTLVDIFDTNGQLLATASFDEPMFFNCKDKYDNLYAVNNADPKRVIRFRVAVN
ncbi:MAG: NHL repeat-containing protein [Candidatus Latescibacterota bacterium]|nr:MAG: NHL repeat-containing protein [Candidatus Latescibacterota bacterium]